MINVCYTVWNFDIREFCAIAKGFCANFSDSVRNGDIGDTITIKKSSWSNFFYTSGDCNICEFATIGEGVIANTGDAVGHGDTFETCKSCIDSGFSSVMIDGSHLPYEENIALTKKVVEYAHQFDVTVEGELGVLAGVEDEVSSDHHTYTNPEEVVDFATRTGCCLLYTSPSPRDPKTSRMPSSA